MCRELDTAFADANPIVGRRAALEELILAAAAVHFTPIDDSELVQVASHLLNDVLADYEKSELMESIRRLTEDGRLTRDRSGRVVPEPTLRSPAKTVRAFEAARDCAESVSNYAPPYGVETEHTCRRRVLCHRLLRPEQERVLGRRAAMGDRDAINRLVLSNTRLAWAQTGSFGRHSSGAMDRDDYFQEACLGLIRAAEKYDSARGFRFSTYAVPWINQATRRAQANFGRVIRLPVHVYEDVRRVRAVIARQEARVGLSPEPDEIAHAAVMSAAAVARLLELSAPVASLDAEPDLLASLVMQPSANGEVSLTESELLEILDATLAEREDELMRLRFGIGGTRAHTLDEVGKAFGITRERVRQIQSRALDQIRPLIVAALDQLERQHG